MSKITICKGNKKSKHENHTSNYNYGYTSICINSLKQKGITWDV